MRRLSTVLGIILTFSLASCHRVELAQSSSADPAIDTLSRQYVDAVQARDFRRAARLFHYPPSETAAALQKDQEFVASAASLFQDQFGTLEKLALAQSPPVLEVGINGGDLAYWEQHKHFVSRVFVAQFSNWGEGRLTIDACKIGRTWEIRGVRYGLPVSAPSSATRVGSVGAELLKRIGSAN